MEGLLRKNEKSFQNDLEMYSKGRIDPREKWRVIKIVS